MAGVYHDTVDEWGVPCWEYRVDGVDYSSVNAAFVDVKANGVGNGGFNRPVVVVLSINLSEAVQLTGWTGSSYVPNSANYFMLKGNATGASRPKITAPGAAGNALYANAGTWSGLCIICKNLKLQGAGAVLGGSHGLLLQNSISWHMKHILLEGSGYNKSVFCFPSGLAYGGGGEFSILEDIVGAFQSYSGFVGLHKNCDYSSVYCGASNTSHYSRFVNCRIGAIAWTDGGGNPVNAIGKQEYLNCIISNGVKLLNTIYTQFKHCVFYNLIDTDVSCMIFGYKTSFENCIFHSCARACGRLLSGIWYRAPSGNYYDREFGIPRITGHHNWFYNCPKFGLVFNTAYDTWEAWKAYAGEEGSVNGIDPLFTNPAGGDFTLQAGSPLRNWQNAGLPVGVLFDFDDDWVTNSRGETAYPTRGPYDYAIAAPVAVFPAAAKVMEDAGNYGPSGSEYTPVLPLVNVNVLSGGTDKSGLTTLLKTQLAGTSTVRFSPGDSVQVDGLIYSLRAVTLSIVIQVCRLSDDAVIATLFSGTSAFSAGETKTIASIVGSTPVWTAVAGDYYILFWASAGSVVAISDICPFQVFDLLGWEAARNVAGDPANLLLGTTFKVRNVNYPGELDLLAWEAARNIAGDPANLVVGTTFKVRNVNYPGELNLLAWEAARNISAGAAYILVGHTERIAGVNIPGEFPGAVKAISSSLYSGKR